VAAARGCLGFGQKGDGAGEAAAIKAMEGPTARAQGGAGARARGRRGARGGAVGSDPGAA
jgi:hypothetical protein